MNPLITARALPWLLLATAASAQPHDAMDVAVLAATCVTCHGPPHGAIPRLQGQSAERLLARLRAFQAGPPGARATVMPLLVRGYAAAELQALAQWFGTP